MMKTQHIITNFKLILLVSFFSAISISAYGQPNILAKKIKTVYVRKTPLVNNVNGIHITTIDKQTLQQNVTNTIASSLMENSSLQIRSTMPGMLATISSRGSSPGHVSLLWNGLNLNAITNGAVDVTLLPAVAFNEVQILQNGFSTAAGGNALSACVVLKNGNEPKNEIIIGAGYGSFSKQNYFVKYNVASQKVHADVLVTHMQSKNEFSFINTSAAGRPIQRLQHGSYNQQNLMSNLSYKATNKSIIGMNFWMQENSRLLPATLTQAVSRSHQIDANKKLNISLSHHYNINLQLDANVALLTDYLNFVDSVVAINSKYKTEQWLANVAFSKQIEDSNLAFQFGAQNIFVNANAIELGGNNRQNRMAFYGNASKFLGRNRNMFSICMRQELVDKKIVPFSASLGYQHKLKKGFGLNSNLSKNYRLPTFNDLYWYQGGNAALNAEQSLNGELELQKKHNIGKWQLNNTILLYAKYIKNWIQWTPVNGIWRPQNLMAVGSIGAEAHASAKYLFSAKSSIGINSFYSYTNCTNQAVAANAANSLHKQLIYVPLHKVTSNIRFAYGKTTMQYTFLLEGSRFTSSDNVNSLPAYTISNLGLTHPFMVAKSNFTCTLNVLNIFNTNYQHIAFNPNPRRNFNINLTYQRKL
jgi:vitamin B12 transporter